MWSPKDFFYLAHLALADEREDTLIQVTCYLPGRLGWWGLAQPE
jgi:hypothetical protein